MNIVTRAAIATLVGGILVLAPAHTAVAADHSAQLDAGYATITLDLGAAAANTTASVLILDGDADAAAPQQNDIVYLNQMTLGADGTLTFRVQLGGGALEDYMIASTTAGGVRYVAPLADAATGGGGTGGGGTGGNGTGGNGTGGGNGSGGSGGTTSGTGGGHNSTAGSGASGLPWTGMADWIVPGLAGGAAAALVVGGLLFALRRRSRHNS